MLINKDFEKTIENKYKEMKGNNLIEDILDKDNFGKLKVFINKEPASFFYSTVIGSDKVYFGAESI